MSASGLPDRYSRWRRAHPLRFAAGVGYLTTRALLEGQATLPGVYMLLESCATWTLISLGMAGILAATTGGPITAFIIAMEAVSGQAMVLCLMACALLSSSGARLCKRSSHSTHP